MQFWMITVAFIGCSAALAEPDPANKPRRDSTKVEELFAKQMRRYSNIVNKKMRCRPTFRKVDVRHLLLQIGLHRDVAENHFTPKTLLVPHCSDTCSHCKMSRGRKQVCVPAKQKEKTFYIQYGLRTPGYYAHREVVAKKCKCQSM